MESAPQQCMEGVGAGSPLGLLKRKVEMLLTKPLDHCPVWSFPRFDVAPAPRGEASPGLSASALSLGPA